jgi:hypothetical protein
MSMVKDMVTFLRHVAALISSAARQPIMKDGALVGPEMIDGMTDASATRYAHPAETMNPEFAVHHGVVARKEADHSICAVEQTVHRGLFGIVLENPLSLRHPFAEAQGFLRRAIVLGPIQFASGPGECLYLTRPRKPKKLVEFEAFPDFGFVTLL